MNEARNLPIDCVFLHSHYWYYVPLRLPPIRNTISPSLYAFFFTFRWWVGSLQFRTTLFIHTASSIPKDSSVLLSSFFTRSMVFAHIPKAQLLFALLSETFLTIRQNSLNVTVCMIARSSCRGYFIHSLSTLYYYNAPSLATRLTGDYRDRTFTGKCGPASLDTQYKKRTTITVVLTIQGMRDSNPHRRFWRPVLYHWTNPLYLIEGIYLQNCTHVTSFFLLLCDRPFQVKPSTD